MQKHSIGFILSILLCSCAINAEEQRTLEHTQKLAVSLSYDDALNSQLDTAIPQLDKHQFKASFYLLPRSEAFANRIEEWRAVAANGHELGNHSLFHGCRGSKPNRDWVIPFTDLDKRSVEELRMEIAVANSLLQSLDGKTHRTLTLPCGDLLVGGEPLLPAVEQMFVGVKGQGVEQGTEILHAPSEVDGKTLISYVQNAKPGTKIVSILFHGIGGDHLAVSEQAHAELLQFLADNQDKYWVDSYVNIMQKIQQP
ncbi:polysaccharide deacetylase family protein [Glaciecola sp. 1036]|uniref:polysaccharide deacetylase family protein n=1 Tax=Alteromonadaceae TaxID=72275 RepID=UPI003CFDA76C